MTHTARKNYRFTSTLTCFLLLLSSEFVRINAHKGHLFGRPQGNRYNDSQFTEGCMQQKNVGLHHRLQ